MASDDEKDYLEIESEDIDDEELDDGQAKKEQSITDLFDVVISNPTPADKRAHHNALERKRRDHIKESFTNLRECVPNINNDKASRAHILKKATDYIVLMKTKNQKHRNDIETMRHQTQTLEEQVHALERIKATSQFAQTQGVIKPDSVPAQPLTEQTEEGEGNSTPETVIIDQEHSQISHEETMDVLMTTEVTTT